MIWNTAVTKLKESATKVSENIGIKNFKWTFGSSKANESEFKNVN